MKEFKGTQGKWFIETPVGKGSWIGNENGYSALSCGNSDEENKANALLISQAPVLLNEHIKDLTFLKNLYEAIEKYALDENAWDLESKLESDSIFNRIKEKEKLIKEATELWK